MKALSQFHMTARTHGTVSSLHVQANPQGTVVNESF